MKRWKTLLLSFWFLALLISGAPETTAAPYEAGNDEALYGHLFQDTVPGIGVNACCPTSAINSFVYLQNRFPAIYGGRLTSSPSSTDDVLTIAGADYMKTDAVRATKPWNGVWGRYLYIESRVAQQTEYASQVATINGQPLFGAVPDPELWPLNRPLPRYMANTPSSVPGVSVPTPQFLYQYLQRGADVGVGIAYIVNGIGNGGHCLSLQHLSFDDATKTGSITFVDPANPTQPPVTYAVWQNADANFLSGYPYLTLDYAGRRAIIDFVIAEAWTPQAVTSTVETGSIVVLGANALFGTLTFRGGILYAGDPQTAWSKSIILDNDGAIFDSASRQLTLSGNISGPGGVNKWGTGTLFLRGTNTYAGGTTFTEGTVNIVHDANLGDPNGNLTFNGGTLQIGADLTSPSRRIVVQEVQPTTQYSTWDPSLIDTGVYRATFGGEMTGSGYLKQTGQGRLTYAGNGSAFAGRYILSSGTLDLQGTLGNLSTAELHIEPSGTLAGTGTLAARTTYNHGTINPGSSVGTLEVTGGIVQESDAKLVIELASATSYDRLRFTGPFAAIKLEGSLKPVLVNGYRPAANTVIPGIVTTEIPNGVVTPTATIDNNTPTRTWQVLYADDHVDLTLTRNYAAASMALNPNQAAVGNMLNSLADTTSGDLATVLNTLDDMTTVGAVAASYSQFSADKASTLPALSLAGSTMQWRSLSNRLTMHRWDRGSYPALAGDEFGSLDFSYATSSSSRSGELKLAYNWSDIGRLVTRAPAESGVSGRWGTFADFVGTFGLQDSTANQTGYNFNIYGFIAGADYRLGEDWLLGAGSGYYRTNSSYDSSGGSAAINSIPLFAYAAYTPGDFYATGFLGYTLNLYDMNRNVSFGGIDRTATSSPNGNQFNAALETGYDFKFTKAIVTPSATLYYSKASVAGFTESGAGSLNLNVDSQSAESVQGGLGVRLSRPFRTGKALILPQVYAYYQHEFSNDSRGLDARLAQGGSTFVFQTDSPGRDFAVLGAGFAVNLEKNLSVQANYNAELGRGNYTAQFLSAGLRWEF